MKTQVTLATIALLLAAAPRGHAAIVLTVNFNNPAAVVFASVANTAQSNATNNYTPAMFFPMITQASGGTLDGVRLSAFYAMAGTANSTGANSSTLMTGASASSDYSNVNSGGADITINTQAFGSTQNFSTASNAFTGSLTANLNQAIANEFVFPAIGTSGNVFALDRPSGQQVVIGQYQVVPEPSALLLCGIGSLAFLRRRR